MPRFCPALRISPSSSIALIVFFTTADFAPTPDTISPTDWPGLDRTWAVILAARPGVVYRICRYQRTGILPISQAP